MADAAAKGKEVLDQSVWEACAGLAVKMLPVGSLVYYFPRGHGDYAFGPLNFLSEPSASTATYLCKIKEIKLFVSETDEVYSVMEIVPCDAASEPHQNLLLRREYNRIRSSAKILSLNDAYGTWTLIPEACAELVFPSLDVSQNSPSQVLHMRDLRGYLWQFEHSYGGSPAHHFLTTGWKEFADCKRLRLGDSVVFMKNEAGELLVGVRRRPPNPALCFFTGLGLRKDNGADITADDVVKAVILAGQGLPFKIPYYPRAGWPSFIMYKKTVDSALRVPWSVGLRIKKVRDKGKIASGTVTRICSRYTSVSWPWKCLEVTWDEPKVVEMVSPWEVAEAGVFCGATSLAGVEGSRRDQSRLPAGGVSGEFKDLASDRADKKNEMNPSPSAAEAGVFTGAASLPGMEGSTRDHSSLPSGSVSGEFKDLASDSAEKMMSLQDLYAPRD